MLGNLTESKYNIVYIDTNKILADRIHWSNSPDGILQMLSSDFILWLSKQKFFNKEVFTKIALK